MSTPIRIIKSTDKQLIDLTNALGLALKASSYLVVFAGTASKSYSTEIDRDDFTDRSYLSHRIEIVFGPQNGLRVVIARGYCNSHGQAVDLNTFRAARQSANFDEYLVAGTQAMSVDQAKLIDRAFSKIQLLPSDNTRDQDVDLGALVATQVEELRSLSVEYHENQLKVDDELRARRAKLEEEAQARIQKALDEIEEDRKKLEIRRNELNDREPQHERRRLREHLTNELSAYLKEPAKGSIITRHSTHFLYIVIGLLFLLFSAWFAYLVGDASDSGSAPFWVQSIKSIASGIGGAAFIWSGLSGLAKTTKRETEHAQALQRYSLDMDRASWIVETLLQMSATETAQIPNIWLEAAARDLFRNTHDNAVKEPQSLDALAALLDSTARAKIGTQGFEFEIDRKAARRLAAQSSGSL